jgi:integrase
MKAIVRHQGLDDTKVSAHSLRYGGATMLATAGLPSYVVAYFGGWSEGSMMVRRYAQLGGQMLNDVSKVMSTGYDKSMVEARVRENTLGTSSR